MPDAPDALAEQNKAPVAMVLPLVGSHLIEASAGSGKTFTLVILFVRLIIERGLRADQILAVTFTRAATAELRQRVRRRLLDCRTALDGGPADPVTAALILGDRATVRLRVDGAIAMFDSAPIYTIHAFAQRALADRAFSAGTSFELEVGDTQDAWQQEVRDFWRKHVTYHDPAHGMSTATHRLFVEDTLAKDSPDRWLTWLLSVRSAVHPHIEHAEPCELVSAETLVSFRQTLACNWHAQGSELEQLLVGHPSLNGQKAARHLVTRWISEVAEHLAGPLTLEVHRAVGHLSREGLSTKLKTPDQALPEHPLIEQLSSYAELQGRVESGLLLRRQRLLIEMFEEVPARVAERLSEERRAGYDDLLRRLDALLHGAQGERFAAALRERYPAALIDEFQDTDDLQDRIFASIYPPDANAVVFLVGDPKQAIYRFRGADIFTYLAAARRAGQRHSLDENHRSSAALIAALNTLYRGHPNPFAHAEILYRSVSAAEKERDILKDATQEDSSALHVIVPPDAEQRGDADGLARNAAAIVAGQISVMLKRAANQALTIGSRPLLAGDIAVLVKSNAQGTMMRQALKRVGVGAADRSRGSVYASEECEWLLLTMMAAVDIHRTDRIMNALASPLFGFDARTLSKLYDDEIEWQTQLAVFERYRVAWERGGVMRLLRGLLTQSEGMGRLAASADGERHLTNLFHLCELIHEESDVSFGLHSQIAWLKKKREAGFDENEEGELRLESDENLVQVMTVHKSKGLEFPVVFVPFMFTGREGARSRAPRRGDMPIGYHDPSRGERLTLDFGSPHYGAAIQRADEESAAEDARVLYVALTRASHRCVVLWDESSQGARAVLTQLILSQPEAERAAPAANRATVFARLLELEKESGGQLRVFEANSESGSLRRSPGPPPVLRARDFAGGEIAPWRLASFSSLMRRINAPELVDRPDHDQIAMLDDASEGGTEGATEGASEVEALGLFRFSFTRGAAAGECLHEILERLAFTEMGTKRAAIASILGKHGMEPRDAASVARWLDEVVNTPLGDAGFRLADVAPAAQIREMDFHLPLTHALVRDLAPVAARHGVVVPRFLEGTIDGFLKGFIDLVVHHEGRYYVLDYKSNWLGPRFSDYRGKRLDEAMLEGGYHLQYLLYCVALTRWLRWRDPGFDFDRQFGGVYYLFIRGMGGASGISLPGDGIFASCPSRVLIEDLDHLLSGQVP